MPTVFVTPRTTTAVQTPNFRDQGAKVSAPTAAGPTFVIRQSATQTWACLAGNQQVLAWADGTDPSTVGNVASVAASILQRWFG